MNVSTTVPTTTTTTSCQNTSNINNNKLNLLTRPALLLRWFFILLMFVSAGVQAQTISATTYPFTNATGAALEDMTTGTTQLVGANLDDNASAVTNIGFEFWFVGVRHTQFSVNANGLARLGATVIGTTFSNTLTSTVNTPEIAPYWDDLYTGTNGQVHYKVVGIAPNRKLVVEWQNMQIPRTAAGNTGAGTFQLWLTETSGKIDFVYGTGIALNTTNSGASIGFNTSASLLASITASTTAVSYATADNLNTAAIASGTKYTFTPINTQVSPTTLSFTATTLTSMTLNWLAASPTTGVVGYAFYNSTDGGVTYNFAGTALGSGTTSLAFTGLTAGTSYMWRVYSYSEGTLSITPAAGTNSTGACSISGTKTVGGGGADYTNITNAVTALLAGGLTGPVILELNSTYPGAGETFPITLPLIPCASATNTITIRLAAAAGAKTISASNATGIFDINGGRYWIIDGRQGGTGSAKDLTIVNTSGTAGPAIRFINEASDNIVRYTRMQSALNSATSGVVFFSTTTGANGNDNNTISNNNIDGGAGATASPVAGVAQNGIYASGTTTTTATNNSGNTISNNEIFNNFVTGAATTCAGILIFTGNTDWTINANSIYQTAARLGTIGIATVYGISIANSTSGNNFIVTNNFIGGSQASAGGSAWSVTNVTTFFANRFNGIGLSVGTTTASSVQGNTVANFVFSSNSSASANSSSGPLGTGGWGGIHIGAGSVNVGTTTGNTIGSASGTGSVSYTVNTNAGGTANGIGIQGSGIVNVSNNTVAGITTSGGTGAISTGIIGINCSATGTVTINNNTIGSTSIANSINASLASTGTTAQVVTGIINSGAATAISITNNTVANLNNAYVPAAANTSTAIRGIVSSSGVGTVTGNTIRNLFVASNSTGTTSAVSVIGLSYTSITAGNHTVSTNTIRALNNGNAAGVVSVAGIYFSGPSAGTNVIARNNIYNIHTGSSNAAASVNGIVIAGGVSTYQNNMIRLGYDAAGAANTTGIIYVGIDKTTTANNNIFHNTVYVGGTGVLGSAANTLAFRRTGTGTDDVRNNIFINQRSNAAGTAKHYSIGLNAITTITNNYNLYHGTGTGYVFGYVGIPGTTDYATLALWKAANPALDPNSVFADPCLANPTAATPDLHLTNCATAGSPADGAGTLIAAITDDFDAETRATLSPVDIGADAGIYGSAGLDVGIIALVRPTATSCHSATEDIVVTLKNFSTADINFATNPVNVTVNVSGTVTVGPLVVNLTTGTLLAGATQPVTFPAAVNTTANGGYTFVSSATDVALTDVTPGNNSNTTNITIASTALSATAASGTSQLCFTGSTSLTATPAGGTAPYTYLWNGGTLPTAAVNNTGTITTTTTYNVVVTDACGLTANASVTVTVNNPTITGTTGGQVCGTGTVSLQATGSAGTTLNWYASNSSTTIIGTGSPFVTPTISTPTSFWVEPVIGVGNISGLGNTSIPTSTGASAERGIVFTATQAFTLVSAQYYSPTLNVTNTVTVRLYNQTTSTQIGSNLVLPIVQGATAGFYTMNLNLPITPGNYRITASFTSSVNRISTGADYSNIAFNNLGPVGTITSGYNSGVVTGEYNYFHNISITAGCSGTRVAVLANQIAAPTLTVSPNVSICTGQSTNLTVSSSNDPDYTYSWTSAPAGFTASGAGPHSVTPAATTIYTVSAVDNTAGPNAGCSTSGTSTVTVNVYPTNVTATVTPTNLCQGGTVNLTSTGNIPGSYVAGYTVGSGGASFIDIGTSGTSLGTFTDDSQADVTFPAFSYNGVSYTSGRVSNNGWLVFGTGNVGTSGGFSNAALPQASTAFNTASGNAAVICAMWDDLLPGANTSIKSQQVGSKFIIQWTEEDNFNATGVGTVTFQIQLDQSNGKIYLVYQDVNYGDILADGGILATVGLNFSSTSALQYSNNTASLTDGQVISYTPNLAPATNFAWVASSGPFTSAVQNPTGVTPTTTPISYTVTVTNNGCSVSATTATVTASTLAIPTPTVVANVLCFGQATGSISAVATGGTPGYTYTIAGPTVNATGAATGTFTGLLAGNYTITATDGAPCSITSVSVTVTQPATAVGVSVIGSTSPTCNNGSDGTITAAGGNGTPGYTYTISGPGANNSGNLTGAYTGLTAGSYTVTVTDANGCMATSSPATVLNNPALIPVTPSNSSPVCSGQNVNLSITETYATYAWTGPVTINNANQQSATAVAPANGNVFTITVTNGNGCTNSATTTVSITANAAVSVTIAASPGTDNCAGTPVTFTATPVNGGGTPTYKWFLNAVEQLGETASTYLNSTLNDQDVVTAQVTSSITCTTGSPATSNALTMSVSPFVTTDVTLASNAAANTVCAGTSVTFTATPIFGGATPTYQFFVNAVSAGPASASNTYTYVPVNGDAVTVEITSSLTCSLNGTATSAPVNMTVNPVPAQATITAGGPVTFCNGGSVTLTSSYSGAGNQWYNNNVLMSGQTNDNLVVSTSGSYTVIYTALGCASPVSAATVVTVNANPTASITGTNNFCTGLSTTLSAASSTAGSGTISSYQWYVGVNPLGTSVTQVATVPGSYTVTVTNSNGCSTTSAAFTVTENAAPTASITGLTIICTGTTVTLDASSSTAGSGTITTYQWKLGAGNVGTNSATYVATVAGSYTVTVTNSNGCITVSAAHVIAATGPLSGAYTIGSGAASCTNYVSFASAIGDLNTKGVSGNVTFNVASAYTETAPVGGLIINYCALSGGLKPSAAQTVTFQGGAIAAIISSQVGTSTTVDGIVKLVGADYITFDKVNLQETATNVTATTQMEWGYALLKCDGNDGSNNNTISNCSITLNKANTASIGIYSGNHIATVTTGLTYTGTAGDATQVNNSRNGNNTFRSNAIQNVYGAVSLNGNSASSGTHSLNDTLNFVGITGAGNTITNFGGGSVIVVVINETNQRGFRVKNNSITGGNGSTSSVTGISMVSGVWGEAIANTIQLASSATSSSMIGITVGFTGGSAADPNLITITGNTIQNFTATSSTAVPFTGITSSAGGTGSIANISSNTVQNNSIGGTGTFTGIANTNTGVALTMNSNIVTGNTKGSTGTMSLMSFASPLTGTINNNSITNNLVTGGSATVTLNCVIGSGSSTTYTFSGNTISNNRVTGMGGSSIATVSGYTNAGSPLNETITNNTISNLFVTGAATPSTGVQAIRGFNNNPLSTTIRNMSGNTISDLYSSSNISAGITGILTSAGATVKIFKNKICNLFPGQNGTSAAFAKGISITSGTTDSVYNNLINIDLSGAVPPAANGVLVGSDAIKGIEVTGGTTVKLLFNTIRLAGNGTGTGFGTSGIGLTSTTPAVDIRNNIVVNLTNGGGLAAANAAVGLRRTSTIALNATGYASTSNNNIWYVAGSATAPFYYDGTTAYPTFAGFKAQVTPRETASQTENVVFQSTACGNANMLKVSTGTPTFVEGGAQAISGITDDYFGTVRSGSSPDIGAHEDVFPNIALIITSVSASPSAPQCVATARTITAVLTPGANPVTSVTLNYSFAGVAQTAIPMTGGPTTYTATLPAAPSPNVLVTWSVTATDGTFTPTANGASYTDAYLNGVTITTSANPTTVCANSPSVLTGVIVGPPPAAPAASSYCASTHASGCSGDDITLVVLGNINNATTGCGGASFYTYFNGGGTQTTSLAATVPSTLTVSFGTDGNQFFGAWIDYDHNGVYASSEFLGASANAGASGTTSVTFTVPVTALNGLTHMRLIGGNDAVLLSTQACGASSSGFGETQDYDVTITGGSAGSVLPGSTFTSYVWRDALNNVVGTAANPTTVNPPSTQTYTLTGTDANGCSVVSAPVTVSVVPLVAGSITQGATSCASGITLTANTTGGGAPYTYVWDDDVTANAYTNTQTINTGALAPGTYNFTVTVTDGCGGSVNMSLGPVTINALPTVTISADPANGLVCGDKVTMTASGASTYAWTPAAGLNVTTGAVVFATPASTTTYTVTGTDANGCVNTATQLITKVVSLNVSATPATATICAGQNVQLNSTATTATPLDAYYTYSASTGVALADTTGSTRILNASNDDTPAAGTPFFTFAYEGVNYSHFSVSPDGWVNLRSVVTASSSDFTNNLEAPTNNPQIAALWDDNATGSDGYVKYVVNGTAPNRVLVLHWFVAGSRLLTTAAANASFQILLYETSNKIEYRYGTIALYNTTPTLSVGLTSVANVGGFMSVTTSNNSLSTVTPNNSNATAPASGTMFSFAYAVPTSTISLSWSPATNLNSTTIANPLASNLTANVNYVLTATNTTTGCAVKDTVIITVNPLPASTFTGLPGTICSSASAVTLTGTPSGGTFTGPGMSGPVFTPSVAGPGTHTITYSYTDLGTGCSNSTSQQVIVTQPTVSFTGLAAAYCINAAAVTLTGNQAPGGTFSGPGITDNANGTASFNPAATGAGVKTITYSYTDGNGCSNSISQNVTVNPLPVVSFTGLAFTYCITDAAVTLTGSPVGGTFSGTGIVGNTFDPAVAGAGGPYTITYSFTNGNGCTGTQSQTVTVNPLPIVSFSGLAATYCTTDAAATLTGSPAGGTFSGTGIVGNTFDPAVAGAGGPYTITYTYSSGGCTVTSTQQVTVTICTPTTITVNLKLFLQGYYAGGGTMQPVLNNQGVAALATEADTIVVELHDATTYALIDTKQAVLSTTGMASATFTQAAGPYVIAVKHRNTIQTWSKNPIACTVSTPLYDFSSAATQAAGDNQVDLGSGVFGLYSGDINQDDFCDANDFPQYDFESGSGGLYDGTYTPTDINGDGFVDSNDFPILDTNIFNGVTAVYP